jgi:hypothetical protein
MHFLPVQPPCLLLRQPRDLPLLIRLSSPFHTPTYWELAPATPAREVRARYIQYLEALAQYVNQDLAILHSLVFITAGLHAAVADLSLPIGALTSLVGIHFALAPRDLIGQLRQPRALTGLLCPYMDSRGMEVHTSAPLLLTPQILYSALGHHLATNHLYTGMQVFILPELPALAEPQREPLTQWRTLLAYIHNPGNATQRLLWPRLEVVLDIDVDFAPARWGYNW